MSDPSAFGFGKFVPGFDFLQNLGQAANPGAKGSPQGMPNMASWVAPTLNIEELDKRIQELKTVQFWLEQNTNALKATIQALEVQKMTLSTLQGMNVNMADLAKAFTAKMPDLNPVKDTATSQEATSAAEGATEASAEAPEKPAVDPMQWWGSLTQQFQNIAAAAVKDVAAKAMKDAPKPVRKKTAAKKARPSRAKKAGAAAPSSAL
ncbi:PhaM family polyhydroxyalkanoate granule multifunctional regulatory protein [Limnohabitans sp. Hippo4]|uniref:PhaM family polyhydroxyalkanoate granule multifunctional regulatory protein n=1 Tax=Limnohabitans sp. Hippo4 TaxID=1826167 RepID=UPI000D35D1A2|nr:PhaM family polyhydroxyalkanoate granule multifunctional regulatory protein [Limnohabitans sp. Hippo4]PUE33621.1 hypothetical protein B9Z46_13470 [Limnohabitans sp. Hippo4]